MLPTDLVNWRSTSFVVRITVCALLWAVLGGLTFAIGAVHEELQYIGGGHQLSPTLVPLVEVVGSPTKSNDGGTNNDDVDKGALVYSHSGPGRVEFQGGRAT